MGDNPLYKEFTDVMNDNELLAKQNRLFEACLHRMELDLAKQQENDSFDHIKHSRGRGSRHHQQEHELTINQLHTLAITEQEVRTKQLQDLEENVARDKSLLKAITEATKIRINEMRKEAYEFKRDIVVGGANAQTGHIMAEKVIRYFQEKKKQKIGLLEKIKVKNNVLKVQRAKMDQQVRQKKEQGESLCSIDFHQLQIKNRQFEDNKKACDDELINLKKTTSKTVQTLNKQKRRLSELTGIQERLIGNIEHRLQVLRRLEPAARRDAIAEGLIKTSEKQTELGKVEKEVERERKKNKKFKKQQSNPDMPQVLDYVNQKSEMYELEAAVRNWERKVEIIEMASRRARVTIRRIERQGYLVDEHGNIAPKEGGAKAQRMGRGRGGGMRGTASRGRLASRGGGRGAPRAQFGVGGSPAMRSNRQVNGTTLPPIDFTKSKA